MQRLRYTLLLAVAMLSLNSFGQELVTDFDKKVIYTDSLNLPENVSALTLINMLPELIQRPGNFIVTNYDVQIEDMSIASAVDVVLSQLHIQDIEKMEVSESPVTSYQKNGQGGAINFVLRSKGKENPNQWGSAGFAVASPLDIAPQVTIGYKNEKFMVRGIVLGELTNSSSDTQTLTYNNGAFAGQSNTVAEGRFRTELARAYMEYNITDKDVVKLNLSEIYTYNRTNTITDFNPGSLMTQRQKSTDLRAFLKYQHKTSRSTITVQAEYNYVPNRQETDVKDRYQSDGDVKNSILAGKLEYKTFLFKSHTADGMLKQGEVSLGSNFNGAFGDQTTQINDLVNLTPVEKIIPQNNTYYVMPYLKFTGTFGKLRLQAMGEFQHYKYEVKRLAGTEKDFSAISNDFTGCLVTEYRFTPDNTLRLMFDRKLQRPTSDQLFPYRLYDADQGQYVQGNPKLTPTMIHQVSLDYIGLYRWDATRRLTYNIGVSYNNITDIVNSQTTKSSGATGGLGATQKYLYFENHGSNNIASANLMALYTYKAFSLSAAGNIYHKMQDAALGKDHYTYYNLSVLSYFKLKEGWHGGACLLYYSKVAQKNASIGDCAIMEMTVGKTWGKFFVYLAETVSFAKNCTDESHDGNTCTIRNYNMYPNTVSAGIKYTF